MLTFGQTAKGTLVNRLGITSTVCEQHTAYAPLNGRVCNGRRGRAGSRMLFHQVGWTNKRFKSWKRYLEYSLSCDNSCIFQHDNSQDKYDSGVSRRSVTTEVRVRSHVSPCEICGGRIGTGTGYS